MELIPGVYETLVSAAIEKKLSALPDDDYFVKKVDIDSAESCKMLSNYLAEVVCEILKDYFRVQTPSKSISAQVEVVNRILQFIESEWKEEEVVTADYRLSDESKLQFLRGIYSKVGYTQAQVEERAKNHPISGYRVSSLFTGGNDISIDDEIKRDIQTADQIDFVVSFIKFEGIRLIYQYLKEFLTKPGGCKT